MAKETYYFPHDYNARTDPKLVKVMAKLGMQGIGVYWCLVEMLYEQGGQLKVSDVDTYAYALRTDIKIIKEILTKFELFTQSGDFYVSPSAVRRLDHRNDIREKNSKNAKKRWEKATAMRPHSDGNATVMQERKGKERKRKEKKEDNIISAEIPDSVQSELQAIVDKWNLFAVAKKLQICQKLHEDRKYLLYQRYKENEFDLDKILTEIKQSDFLLGKNKKSSFRVSFDWLIENDTNYTKILEGKYRGNAAPEKPSIEDEAFRLLELRKSTLVKGYNACIRAREWNPVSELARGIISRLPDEKGYSFSSLKMKLERKIREYIRPHIKELEDVNKYSAVDLPTDFHEIELQIPETQKKK